MKMVVFEQLRFRLIKSYRIEQEGVCFMDVCVAENVKFAFSKKFQRNVNASPLGAQDIRT